MGEIWNTLRSDGRSNQSGHFFEMGRNRLSVDIGADNKNVNFISGTIVETTVSLINAIRKIQILCLGWVLTNYFCFNII